MRPSALNPISRKYLLLLVACAIFLLSVNAFRQSLKYDVFHQIQFGMEEEQVAMILHEHGVRCEYDLGSPGWLFGCEFSDYFRRYHIAFDSPNGADGPRHVDELGVSYKKPINILAGN
jgi:hypothetical protein